ncbi:MAG: DUF2330 domain-containing protein, partial [Deinococcota bacterium]
MKQLFVILIVCIISSAQAFCGFYVGKADSQLFNEASKVIIARDGNRTVLSMANDYRGELSEFALVVPIPYVFDQSQIQVGNISIFDRIDAYSAPRLVEYFDNNPCPIYMEYNVPPGPPGPAGALSIDSVITTFVPMVTVEASFSVGEYDILILSAEEATGLETWLLQNDYNIPEGATEIFNGYIDAGMKFFVARVNVDVVNAGDSVLLRPLVMAFESAELMLPIQLGTVNAAGKQDLIVFLLSPEGRIVTDNYPVVDIPSEVNLPGYIDDTFTDFYVSMFDTLADRAQYESGIVFLEHAWDMSWCDPCAANPLNNRELLQAGVFWNEVEVYSPPSPRVVSPNSSFAPLTFSFGTPSTPPNVYLTRLHLRYDRESHPEDLRFRVTDNRENFQGRYIL